MAEIDILVLPADAARLADELRTALLQYARENDEVSDVDGLVRILSPTGAMFGSSNFDTVRVLLNDALETAANIAGIVALFVSLGLVPALVSTPVPSNPAVTPDIPVECTVTLRSNGELSQATFKCEPTPSGVEDFVAQHVSLHGTPQQIGMKRSERL